MISLIASQSIKFYKTLTNIKIANPLLSGSRGYFKLQNDTKISLISSLEAKIWFKKKQCIGKNVTYRKWRVKVINLKSTSIIHNTFSCFFSVMYICIIACRYTLYWHLCSELCSLLVNLWMALQMSYFECVLTDENGV